jgi:hypothetical protein
MRSSRTANLDHGSAFQTLRHLVDVDWSWREACWGTTLEIPTCGTTGSSSMSSAIHAFCLEEDVRLRSHGVHDEAGLAESMKLGPTSRGRHG